MTIVDGTATVPAVSGEDRLMQPLLDWLSRTRRVHSHTRLAFELPWYGRRVDLATMTTSRRTTAYELKLGGVGRALEQAAYNRLAFDRSFVVTASTPRPENLLLAAEHGIGIIVIKADTVRHVLDSPFRRTEPELRARLIDKLRDADPLIDHV